MLSVLELAENYCALAVAILTHSTPERSFELLEKGAGKRTYRSDITEEDIKDMIKLKEGMTYKAIGELYGLSECVAWRKMKNYIRRTS